MSHTVQETTHGSADYGPDQALAQAKEEGSNGRSDQPQQQDRSPAVAIRHVAPKDGGAELRKEERRCCVTMGD